MAFIVNGGREFIVAGRRTHPDYHWRGIGLMTSRYMFTSCKQLFPDLDISQTLYTSVLWKMLEPKFEADPTKFICRKVLYTL